MLDLVVDHHGSLCTEPTTRAFLEIAAILQEPASADDVPKWHWADQDAPSRVGSGWGRHSQSVNTSICSGAAGGQIDPRTSRVCGTASSSSGERIWMVRR